MKIGFQSNPKVIFDYLELDKENAAQSEKLTKDHSSAIFPIVDFKNLLSQSKKMNNLLSQMGETFVLAYYLNQNPDKNTVSK